MVKTLESLSARPKVLICASAVGFYGDRGDETLDENSTPGSDFLADVCESWEKEAKKAEPLGIRVVRARTGIVLGHGGGALAKMLLPFRLGIGGRLGSGRQWMSWIHIDDEIGLLLHAAKNESVSGPINLIAPHPVTNQQFTKVLGSCLKRPTIFPVPGLALKVALGEFGSILLGSQKAFPKVAEKSSYTFKYPKLEEALRALCG